MINRRNFLAAAAAELGLLVASRGMAESARFPLGFSTYTFRGVSVAQMIHDLGVLKIREIELSNPQFMPPAVTMGAITGVRTQLEQGGIRPVSWFGGEVASQSDLDRTIAMARALGARHVTGWAVGDALKAVDARFTREGMKFGIHNHWIRGQRFAYQSPEDLLRAFAETSDTVGATLDIGHMASCGYDPVAALVKVWPRLQVVHLKDVKRVGDDLNVPLGTGIAKNRQVIELLKKRRFSNLVAIEYEANPDNPMPVVKQDVEFARKLM